MPQPLSGGSKGKTNNTSSSGGAKESHSSDEVLFRRVTLRESLESWAETDQQREQIRVQFSSRGRSGSSASSPQASTPTGSTVAGPGSGFNAGDGAHNRSPATTPRASDRQPAQKSAAAEAVLQRLKTARGKEQMLLTLYFNKLLSRKDFTDSVRALMDDGPLRTQFLQAFDSIVDGSKKKPKMVGIVNDKS